ncbi:hypothetical protein BH11MYX2_BH11MYX2_08550 [soil metagenome]
MTNSAYTQYGLEALDANGPLLLFAEHHRSLHRAGESMLANACEGDCVGLVAEYRSFERQVCEHLDAEEELVLPCFERENVVDAATIRAEHSELRKVLEQTGLALELHEVRLEALRHVLERLRAHATFEDRTMYPWAQVHLPLHEKERTFEWLTRSLQKLANAMFGAKTTHPRSSRR